jgi:hypothetical protein
MKKTILFIALLGVAVISLGIAGLSYAAQTPAVARLVSGISPVAQVQAEGGDGFLHPGGPGGRGFGDGADSPLKEYFDAAMSEALGLTQEDVQARLEAGETMQEIIESQGFTLEEWQAAMDAARADALAQAVADGVITQEQADAIAERGNGRGDFGPGGKMDGMGAMNEYFAPILEEVLGMTPQDLMSRLQAGETFEDILAEQGLTTEAFQAQITAAANDAVAQAVADGSITQEQADNILAKLAEWDGTGFPLGGGRPGGRGPGGRGPGGFGPGGSDTAPATDSGL